MAANASATIETVAHRVKKARPVKRVPTGIRAKPENRVPRVCPATTRQYRWIRPANAYRARSVRADNPVNRVRLELLVRKEARAKAVRRVATEARDQPVTPELQVNQVVVVPQVPKATTAKTVAADAKGRPDPKDQRAHLETAAHLVILAVQENWDHLVSPVMLDHQAETEKRANAVTQEVRATPVDQAKTPNIVLALVADMLKKIFIKKELFIPALKNARFIRNVAKF